MSWTCQACLIDVEIYVNYRRRDGDRLTNLKKLQKGETWTQPRRQKIHESFTITDLSSATSLLFPILKCQSDKSYLEEIFQITVTASFKFILLQHYKLKL